MRTRGKKVFQTGGTLSDINGFYVITSHEIEIYIILVHFIKIVLSLLLYKYKDHSSVKRMHVICFFLLPAEFLTIPGYFRL